MPEGVRSDTEPGAEPPIESGAALSDAEPDRFAAQRAALAGLAERPLDEHADVFAGVHAQLQAALAEIDGI